MTFRHGRLAELLLNGVDISGYFSSAEWAAKVTPAPVDVFKTTWHQFIPGELESTLVASGYYQSDDVDQVRDDLISPGVGQLTYAPAGATAIGDFCRLMNVNFTDYKTGSKIGSAVTMDFTAQATNPVGIGVSLHPLASENLGTITGTGDGVLTSAASTTGAIGHLHVTAVNSAVASSFKFQDATTIGGVYADITSGAFTNMTAVGSQRLVIPGTIRQFVRCVAVIGPATTTYAVSFART